MIDVLAAIHNVDVFKETTVNSLNIHSILNLKGTFKYFKTTLYQRYFTNKQDSVVVRNIFVSSFIFS